MATFALVHGAFHGGWCWELLAPELARRGHDVRVMDLPCEDPEAGVAEYTDVVLAACEDVSGPLIVVGHSMGGLTIASVAAARPVTALVYLCAMVPVPGRNAAERWIANRDHGSTFGRNFEYDEQLRSRFSSFAGVREDLYHDCPPEAAAAAHARLRWQAAKPGIEVCPLEHLPSVPASYVLARDDRAIMPAVAAGMARELLGVEPIEIDGDHSPMLGRPAELAVILATLATLAS